MTQKDTKEDLENWGKIIDSIDKSDIPIEFVSRIIFDSKDGDEEFDAEFNLMNNEIDITQLRENGYSDDLIQEIVSSILEEVSNYSGSVDFLIDIRKVASSAQQITDTYLKRT